MSFLRRKSSAKTHLDNPDAPVDLTLPPFTSSNTSDDQSFSSSASRLSSAIPLTGNAEVNRRTSINNGATPRVSMVPIPRPQSQYQRALSSDGDAHDDSGSTTSPMGGMSKSPTYPDLRRSASGRQSIASLYPSPTATGEIPSSTFDRRPSSARDSILSTGSRMTKSSSLPNFVRRNHRVAPPYNLIVVGARSTGKTGWIRTLLANMELGADAATSRQKIQDFGLVEAASRTRRRPKIAHTKEMQSISLEVVANGEKVALTCVDTVALDPVDGDEVGSPRMRRWGPLDEIEVERQLGKVLRTIEERFDETLKAESQVVRPSARTPDQHFHLCLFFIHPDSIATRPRKQGLEEVIPVPKTNGAVAPAREDEAAAGVETPDAELNGKFEHEDGEIDEQDDGEDEMGMSEIDLKCIKKLAQRVHVLPIIARADEMTVSRLDEVKAAVRRDLARSGLSFGAFASSSGLSLEEESEPPTPTSATHAERSESVRNGPAVNVVSVEGGDSVETNGNDDAPIKVIRIARGGLALGRRRSVIETVSEEADSPAFDEILPFAVVAPELPSSSFTEAEGSEDKFERRFKYGSLNVLDEEHCDFTPLQSAIFAKMKTLKDTTRLNKYEPFRTQRLLDRRAVAAAAAGSPQPSTTQEILQQVSEI